MGWEYDGKIAMMTLRESMERSNEKIDDLIAAVLTLAEVEAERADIDIPVDELFAQKRELLKNRK